MAAKEPIDAARPRCARAAVGVVPSMNAFEILRKTVRILRRDAPTFAAILDHLAGALLSVASCFPLLLLPVAGHRYREQKLMQNTEVDMRRKRKGEKPISRSASKGERERGQEREGQERGSESLQCGPRTQTSDFEILKARSRLAGSFSRLWQICIYNPVA